MFQISIVLHFGKFVATEHTVSDVHIWWKCWYLPPPITRFITLSTALVRINCIFPFLVFHYSSRKDWIKICQRHPSLSVEFVRLLVLFLKLFLFCWKSFFAISVSFRVSTDEPLGSENIAMTSRYVVLGLILLTTNLSTLEGTI